MGELDPDFLELSAVEKVRAYVRNGRKVKGYTRKGDGPNHRADFRELEELRSLRAYVERLQESADRRAELAKYGAALKAPRPSVVQPVQRPPVDEQAEIRAILRKIVDGTATFEEESRYNYYIQRIPDDVEDLD